MIIGYLEKYSFGENTYYRNKLNDYLRRSHSGICFCRSSVPVTYFDCPLVRRPV